MQPKSYRGGDTVIKGIRQLNQLLLIDRMKEKLIDNLLVETKDHHRFSSGGCTTSRRIQSLVLGV